MESTYDVTNDEVILGLLRVYLLSHHVYFGPCCFYEIQRIESERSIRGMTLRPQPQGLQWMSLNYFSISGFSTIQGNSCQFRISSLSSWFPFAYVLVPTDCYRFLVLMMRSAGSHTEPPPHPRGTPEFWGYLHPCKL